MEFMNRVILIQLLIKKYGYSNYLEIGTQEGKSFFPIRCRKKTAVDPYFKISNKERIKWILKNPYNLRAQFFELTSDNFFLTKKKFLNQNRKLDIALIDGLHTFSATLNDVLNCLKFLQKNGTIIMHDCFPPHKAAAIEAESESEAEKKGKDFPSWTGEWCGDSWKAIAYLRKNYPGKIEAYVLDMDYGLGIVKIVDSDLNLKIDQELYKKIESLTYEDLLSDPEKWIGLRDKNKIDLI